MKGNIVKLIVAFSMVIPMTVLANYNAFYYFPGPFDTQTYNPVTKESILEKTVIYGAKNVPQKNVQTLKVLLDINDGQFIEFNDKKIRALVVIDKKIYFIDSNGAVNTAGHTTTFINKHKFTEMLSGI